MPFLLVTGLPASGKSTVVDRIAVYLREAQSKHEVVVVRDEDYAGYDRNCYTDSNKEKMHRGFLRSSLQKALAKNSIVICDAMNYIKGFRYELFLVGKGVKTTYAVLCVKCDEATSGWLNGQREERYTPTLISQLFSRYESPDGRQRWDSPLFLVETGPMERERVSEEEMDDVHMDLQHPSPRFVSLPLEELREWLCEGTQLSENASTATAPLAPPDLLHLLDRVTQQVVQHILAEQKLGGGVGGDIVVSVAEEGGNTVRALSRPRTMGELSRLRRQFVSFTKSNPVHDSKRIASLFINFLNSSQ